jgi:hypothetical protein
MRKPLPQNYLSSYLNQQKMKIIEIGNLFERKIIPHVAYLSDDYLLDADVIVISLSAIVTEFGKTFSSNGVAGLIMKDETFQNFQTKVAERNAELTQYFNNGGNLFVCHDIDANLTFPVQFADQSEKEMNYDFLQTVLLDSNDFKLHKKKGDNLSFPDQAFAIFFDHFYCSYHQIYTKHKGVAIAKIKNTEQAVSLNIRIGKGHIILLPDLYIPHESQHELEANNIQIEEAIIDLDLSLSARQPDLSGVLLHEWVANFHIGNETADLAKLAQLEVDKLAIEKTITDQAQLMEIYDQFKILLCGTGTPLEFMVREIFIAFGYEVLDTQENRDDLIIRRGDQVAVIEVKGVKGSAGEKNAAQLMKWVNTYHLENDVLPKGILIVNAFKDLPLDKRKEPAFPNQMLAYSKQMGINLMTTVQLLGIYLDFAGGQIEFDKANQLLFETIGELNYKSEQINKV